MKKNLKLSRCPRCGGRNLYSEETLSRSVQVVVCGDCDFQIESYHKNQGHGRKNKSDLSDQPDR